MNTEAPEIETTSQTHASLLDGLRNLEESLSEISADKLAAVRGQLEATLSQLLAHFRFEEQNGYFAAVRKRLPQWDRDIDRLLADHRRLARSLETLIREAEAVQSVITEFQTKGASWIDRVRRHERDEDHLLQDAYNRDLGTAD